MEWRQFYERLRALEPAALPKPGRDLLDLYDARAGETQAGEIRLTDHDSAPDALVTQVARALQTGNASSLARFTSRDVANGTLHTTAPITLIAGALLDLLEGGDSRRYLCAQACLLALAGVPEISLEALLGVRGEIDEQTLLDELRDDTSLRCRIASRFLGLLNLRRAHSAFHPAGQQTVLDLGSAVFGLERIAPDEQERVIALHNVTAQVATVEIATGGVRRWRNLHLDEAVDIPAVFTYRIVLSPYQVAWLRAE